MRTSPWAALFLTEISFTNCPKWGIISIEIAWQGSFGDRMREKISNFIKKAVVFLLNPRFVLCFGIGWMITNGWSYVMLALGLYYEIGWMIAVASGYLAFLWLPISPEKIVTVAIAIALLRVLFPKDEKTLAVLTQMFNKAKAALKKENKRRNNEEEEK